MLLRILFMLPTFLAGPEVLLNWTNQKFEAVRIRVAVADELLSRCLKSGLAMEYNYQIRLCRRRAVWFDACADKRRE